MVTDFKFLADVFQQLFFQSAPRTVHLRSLGETIPCWTSADLEKIYPKSKATVVRLTFMNQPQGYKTFSCSAHLITFIVLINVKMPTIVGIFTFISMINTTSKNLKARNVFISFLVFPELLKFYAPLS